MIVSEYASEVFDHLKLVAVRLDFPLLLSEFS